ncbi:MAG: GntR family transcriptional regulator [Novosphingobium sp.]
MVGDHSTSERVYRQLKIEILDGVYNLERLNISLLADRYRSSATPVREALLRLVGESIVSMPQTGGFEVPRLDRKGLTDLYDLGLGLMLMVSDRLSTPSPVLAHHLRDSRLGWPVDAVFEHLADATDNAGLGAAVRANNVSLHRIRRIEERRLPGLEREFGLLVSAVNSEDPAALRRVLSRYFRRRLARIDDILEI